MAIALPVKGREDAGEQGSLLMAGVWVKQGLAIARAMPETASWTLAPAGGAAAPAAKWLWAELSHPEQLQPTGQSVHDNRASTAVDSRPGASRNTGQRANAGFASGGPGSVVSPFCKFQLIHVHVHQSAHLRYGSASIL